MKVFASNYLETTSSESLDPKALWNWTPENENIQKIYASGGNTRSRESTYHAEKDNRADDDRPNEGRAIYAA